MPSQLNDAAEVTCLKRVNVKPRPFGLPNLQADLSVLF